MAAITITFCLEIVVVLVASAGSCGVAGASSNPGKRGGASYYVAPDGNDANAGTYSASWATIQHAANSVGPGAIVNVAPGRYNGPIVTRKSGTSGASIRFISTTRWGAKIQSAGGDATWQNTGDYVDIVGFDVTGIATHQGIWQRGSYGRILGNLVHHIAIPCDANGGSAINSEGFNTTIDGNLVHDIGIWGTLCNGVHGIYVSQPGAVIQNNVLYRVIGAAINMYHDSATAATIVNNTVFNSGAAAGNGACYGAGIAIGGANNDHTQVNNNILRDIHCWAINELDSDRGPNNAFVNNLLYNDALAIHANSGTVAGTINSDPRFVNYIADGSGDYHLTATSPAINHGVSHGAPRFDIDGGHRPTGDGYDIGAYEFGSSSATWPWF